MFFRVVGSGFVMTLFQSMAEWDCVQYMIRLYLELSKDEKQLPENCVQGRRNFSVQFFPK